MFWNVFFSIILLWLTYFILSSIKSGKIESYYGEAMSPTFEDEPIGFVIMILVYVAFWIWIAYLLYNRWPFF